MGMTCRTSILRLPEGLTFELSGRRRQDARPGPVRMYSVPPARAWWPAVGAPLERGVRLQCAWQGSGLHFHARHCVSRSALRQEQSRYSASAAPAEDFAWRSAPCSSAGQGLGLSTLTARRYPRCSTWADSFFQSFDRRHAGLKRDAASNCRLWRLPRAFGLAGAHAGPD